MGPVDRASLLIHFFSARSSASFEHRRAQASRSKMLKRPSGSTCASCRGVSELLAGVLVTVEDIRLDAAMPSLPGSEIDVHFSARLGFTRRAGEVHHEFMRPPAFGNAASLPQELLQVEDLVGIADVDVHAAGRSGVAATKSPVSLSSQTPVCQ